MSSSVIINPFGSEKHVEELKKLNAEHSAKATAPNFETYAIPCNIQVINANPISVEGHTLNKVLLMGNISQWVMNRVSTKLYLEYLDELNKTTWLEK